MIEQLIDIVFRHKTISPVSGDAGLVEWQVREAEGLHRGFVAKYPDSPFREEILW